MCEEGGEKAKKELKKVKSSISLVVGHQQIISTGGEKKRETAQ